jgi:hypothetical protein
MFDRCRLLLTQGNQSVEVTIDGTPRLPSGTTYKEMFTWTTQFQYWAYGRYYLSAHQTFGNHSSDKDTAYWVFRFLEREMRFVEFFGPGQGYSSRAVEYGELVREPMADVTLYNAKVSNVGIEPYDLSGSGSGQVRASGAGLNVGPLSWKLSAIRKPGEKFLREP